VIAHRGASAHAPENTVEAFALAATLAADMVELDVRPTADGALAVHHDAHLPDGRAIVEVAAADLPAPVPLLDAALAACGPLAVNVEIKSSADEPGFDPSRSLARPVAAAIRAWAGEVVVSSFDPAMVDAVRDVDAGLPTAQLTFLLERPLDETLAWIAGRGHDWWHPWQGSVGAATVAAAHDAGLNHVPAAVGARGRQRRA
jgi:glycerophosphoryl diester phosphodiesterase